MERHEIARQRLTNQRVSGNALKSAVDVVKWFGAVQSQEYPYAKWGLSQRAPSLQDDVVEQALTDGVVLRTHAMRPTWHFVAADDIRWLQALTGPRVHAVNRSLYRNNGLDEPLLVRARDLITRALQEGVYLTRQELAGVLSGGGIEASGQRLAYIVMHNELDAVICSGPRRGKRHTYALVEERAPLARTLPHEEALAELTRRYFTSHGPATVKDFVWWSGLTTPDARLGIELVGTEVQRFEQEGTSFYHTPTKLAATVESPSVRMLQAYDEYIVAYTESRHIMNIGGLAAKMQAGRPLHMHALIVDGQFAGHWRRFDAAKSSSIGVTLARQLTDNEWTSLEEEVVRLATYSGVEVTLAAERDEP